MDLSISLIEPLSPTFIKRISWASYLILFNIWSNSTSLPWRLILSWLQQITVNSSFKESPLPCLLTFPQWSPWLPIPTWPCCLCNWAQCSSEVAFPWLRYFLSESHFYCCHASLDLFSLAVTTIVTISSNFAVEGDKNAIWLQQENHCCAYTSLRMKVSFYTEPQCSWEL